tara:strand:- start:1139 stop:1807 length:669 start_codon:yes stop_codon:yes gene_type:complete
MKLLLEKWNKFVNEAVAKKGKFTIITRGDGKVVLISQEVFDHIGTHGSYGVGSVFAGNITPEMIIDFIENKAAIADTGGFVKGDFPGGGYELVKPVEWVKKNIPDAQYATTKKQEFNREAGKMVDVPVLAAKTNKPAKDFATAETSVGVFKYDPNRSSADQNNFIEQTPELKAANESGKLFALATAFPGGFEIEGMPVPRVTEWGGTDPEKAKWAVIIPARN